MKIILTCIVCGIICCSFSFTKPKIKNVAILYNASDTSLIQYSNPVFTPTLADPTIIYDDKTHMFYAYGTADNWADGIGTRLVPILVSPNLLDWTYVGNAFNDFTKPKWKEGGLWAPDIVKVNDKFHLYYSISIWDDPNPGIGVAVADSPIGPFIDYGQIISSNKIDVPNSIDPFFYEENGKKYLFWGSFSSRSTQGIHGIELSSDGLNINSISNKFKIAAGDWEAVVIHKKNDYYYMFGSKGSCCEGKNSTYRVLVGRSKNIKGPYLDKEGNDIAERDNGTLILKGNKQFVGPGHNSRILTDAIGNDWVLYHAIDSNFPKLSNGVNRRVLFVDQVIWSGGWPLINNSYPSIQNRIKPNFN